MGTEDQEIILSTSTEIVDYSAQLAEDAKEAAAAEANTGGARFFSMRGGILKLGKEVIPGNKMVVVVSDFIFENSFYDIEWNPKSEEVFPPLCYAFSRGDEKLLAPHPDVIAAGQAQNDTCKDCEKNKYGSADKGSGKACSNRRRIALLSAGSYNSDGTINAVDDPSHFEITPFAYLKIPPTSTGGFATYVKALGKKDKPMPPWGVYTEITVVPDGETQFKVLFKALADLPNAVLGVSIQRHKESMSTIEFPYVLEKAASAAEKQAPTRQKVTAGGRKATGKNY